MASRNKVPFPAPTRIAGLRYWTRRQVREYRALCSGEPTPAARPDDEVLINANQVRDLFGGVSRMWLWRKLPPEARGDAADHSVVAL